jgi:serine/threonine-protein kinase PknK
VVAQFLRIAPEPVPDLRQSGIPDDISAVVEKAMARDPADRPAAAASGGGTPAAAVGARLPR